MNIKRIVINILIILAAFLIFALWYHSSIKGEALKAINKAELQAGTPDTNSAYQIYLITNDKQYQFWEYMNQGVADMARLLNLTYIWDAPDTPDINRQIEIINNAVAKGADVIILSPYDGERLVEPVREAKNQGVKIIYVNSPGVEEGMVTLSTDNFEAGKMAGYSMLEELALVGAQRGTIGIVSESEINPTILQRESGFQEVIKADGRFTLLEPVYTGGDPEVSEKAAARIIEEHPDLVGIFGSNEGTSVGVGNAIKADDKRIVGIGFDRSEATMELLDQEALKAIIVQNPYTMGYLGMAEAYAALKGLNTGPPYIDTGVTVIRKR